MKYVLIGALVLGSLGAYAQKENETNPQGETQAPVRKGSSLWVTKNCDDVPNTSLCRGLKYLGRGDISQNSEPYVSIDRRFGCSRKAAYTVDFADCKSAVNFYNSIVMAEKGMQTQQNVRTNLSNQNISKQTSEQAASGDIQGAAVDGSKSATEHVIKMYEEQKLMYTAAVGSLGTQLGTWKKKKSESVQDSTCKDDTVRKKVEEDVAEYTKKNPPSGDAPDCRKDVALALESAKTEVFANGGTRTGLALALSEYIKKGLNAAMNEKLAKGQLNDLNKVSNSFTEEDQDLMLEMCIVNPTHPDCVKAGNRVGGNFGSGSGSFGFGDGGSNAFNFGEGSSEFGDPGAIGTTENQNVDSVSSPFNDDIKTANGILNPAPAASVTPGGGDAGGGGGGGVGGGMGGGGASLGGDLNGEDKAKGDPEIKSGKSGTYASAGGGKFTAVAKGSEDSNPFASLFDQKDSGGGVVEDRDIASATDGPGSGLFQKISKRYSQVQADKRIEANNLE